MPEKNPSLIAKNGLYLLIRQILIIAIAFYTTRLTLKLLGDVDYGINNIIGGIISIFSIISLPIINALQRFFNVEFSRKELEPDVIFSTSIKIITIMAFTLVFLFETIGLYLVKNVLDYPTERTSVVYIIYQVSILTTILSFYTIPYTALLFSKENFRMTASMDIFEYVYKLAFLLCIPFVEVDYLVAFTIMLLIGKVILLLTYNIYAKKKYSLCLKIQGSDNNLFKNMISFSGWNMIDSAAGLLITYVPNFFLNIFGGVLYNTAFGISRQVGNSVTTFISNIMKSVDPQITSSTVSRDDSYRNRLILTSSKVSFSLLSLVCLCFYFVGEELISLWLGYVPENVVLFSELMLISTMMVCLVLPLRTLILAIGKVKRYFICLGSIAILCLIIMYFLLKLGCNITIVMYSILIYNTLSFLLSVIETGRLSTFSCKKIMIGLIPAFMLALLSVLFMFVFKCIFPDTLVSTIIGLFVDSAFFVTIGYFCVLDRAEKKFLKHIVMNKKNKIS